MGRGANCDQGAAASGLLYGSEPRALARRRSLFSVLAEIKGDISAHNWGPAARAISENHDRLGDPDAKALALSLADKIIGDAAFELGGAEFAALTTGAAFDKGRDQARKMIRNRCLSRPETFEDEDCPMYGLLGLLGPRPAADHANPLVLEKIARVEHELNPYRLRLIDEAAQAGSASATRSRARLVLNAYAERAIEAALEQWSGLIEESGVKALELRRTGPTGVFHLVLPGQGKALCGRNAKQMALAESRPRKDGPRACSACARTASSRALGQSHLITFSKRSREGTMTAIVQALRRGTSAQEKDLFRELALKGVGNNLMLGGLQPTLGGRVDSIGLDLKSHLNSKGQAPAGANERDWLRATIADLSVQKWPAF